MAALAHAIASPLAMMCRPVSQVLSSLAELAASSRPVTFVLLQQAIDSMVELAAVFQRLLGAFVSVAVSFDAAA